MDAVRHRLSPQDRHDEVTSTYRRGEHLRAIGDRIPDSIEQLGLLQYNIGAARGRSGIGIGPAIPRRDEPQLREPEIEHRARGFADVLTKLRADENDNWR